MPSTAQPDLLVVGGGVIGLSVAWQAGRAGLSVTVLERDRFGTGAGRVAAGMLAPVSEADYGAAARLQLDLGLRSAALWPAFADALEEAAGTHVGLLATGTLLLAVDDDEAAELERSEQLRRDLGLAVERLLPSRARALEPALAPGLRLALSAPEDHCVDPRLVLEALRRACLAGGVELLEQQEVVAVEAAAGDGHATALLADGRSLSASQLLLAAGSRSGLLELAGPALPVRPVKGQTLRLRDPAGPGLLSRVLRYGRGYVVPRGDGRYVLGATVEERGFEETATAGGIHELLRDAHELLPGISELEIEELAVGLRPGTPDNVPLLGRLADGVLVATGHFRNGVLLAPLSAELIVGSITGELAADGRRLLEACVPAHPAGDGSVVAGAASEAARAAAVAG